MALDATTLFIVGLFLLVGCAVLAGEIASRLGQAALVGQLIVGIVFGPTVLGPVLGLSTGTLSTEFTGLEILATFFVLMMAGLSVTPEQVYSTGVTASLLGIGMFVLPFLTGSVVVHLLYPALSTSTALFVALTISITALPVLAVMLDDFGLLRSRFGTYVLNAALVNELAAVTTFSVLLRVSSNGGAASWTEAIVSGLTVAVFLTSMLAVHYGLRSLRQAELWDRVVERVRTGWRSRELGFALLMIGGLGAALYSQALGLTYLIGAFYAGLVVSPQSIGVKEHREISRIFDAVTWGFFVPLFFALVGFGMDLRSLATSPLELAAFAGLCVFAFLAKVFVGGAITRALGWTGREALGAGFLVSSRGAVELAMATLLLDIGVFDRTLFTVVAGVGLVTTLIAPICARRFVGAAADAAEQKERALRDSGVTNPWAWKGGRPKS